MNSHKAVVDELRCAAGAGMSRVVIGSKLCNMDPNKTLATAAVLGISSPYQACACIFYCRREGGGKGCFLDISKRVSTTDVSPPARYHL